MFSERDTGVQKWKCNSLINNVVLDSVGTEWIMWLAGCVINTGGFVRIKVRLPPDALEQMWCFTRSLQQQQDLGTKAAPDSSILDEVFMFFSQLTLQE